MIFGRVIACGQASRFPNFLCSSSRPGACSPDSDTREGECGVRLQDIPIMEWDTFCGLINRERGRYREISDRGLDV